MRTKCHTIPILLSTVAEEFEKTLSIYYFAGGGVIVALTMSNILSAKL